MWVFVAGLVFAAAGGLGMYQSWRLNRAGKRVPGIVVDLHWRSAGMNGQICYPVVEFRTVEGQVVRAETRVGGSRVIARQGEQVPVVYDPDKPERVMIDTRAGRGTWVPVVIAVAGLGLIAWAVYDRQV